MCERDSGVGRAAGSGGYTRHHLKAYAGVGQSFNFFAPAPEDKRVSALETDHLPTLPGQIHQSLIDLVLRQGVVSPLLPHMNHLGSVWNHGQYFRRHQAIVKPPLRRT